MSLSNKTPDKMIFLGRLSVAARIIRTDSETAMADYKEKFDEWQQAARRKARELDEKYSISDLVSDSARAAEDAARRGAETVANGAERLRAEADRLAEDRDVGDTARRAADEAVR